MVRALNAHPHSRPEARALTLLELLVSVALSVILIGVMTFVWVQSNEIFSSQLNRIETYQRVRVIMDTMERDLANTQLTTNMEFFSDDDQNGFFDDTTTPPDQKMLPAGAFRAPNSTIDPLHMQPEFQLDPLHELNQSAYVRSPTIVSPTPYEIETDGYLERRSYWRDEVYVRSFITIGDKNRPALIHYRLVQTAPGGRSMLRRRIWFTDSVGAVTEFKDQVSILASDVCDLKIGFLFKPNPLSGDLHKYHVAPQPAGYSDPDHNSLLNFDHDRGFVSTFDGRAAEAPYVQEVEALSAQHAGTGHETQVGFLFEGNARIEERDLGPVALRGLRGDVSDDLATKDLGPGTVGFSDYDNFDFRGVRPGTRVLVYGATDDDAQIAPGATREAGARFPPQLLTIETIPAEGATATNDVDSYVSLQFLEPINFSRLRARWLGNEEKVVIAESDYKHSGSGSSDLCGPARTLTGSFNVHYRVGFLPAAFVIRMSVDDRNNQRVIPMERVVRLLQQ